MSCLPRMFRTTPIRTTPIIVIAIVATMVAGAGALAAEPEISLIEPAGMQRGTEADVFIRGDRLADAKELLFAEQGLSVIQITPEGGKTLKVRIAAAADCPPGIQVLRVRTDTGISNLWSFSVGVLPETAEVEPNGDFASPQSITTDTTINGVTLKEDVDYYVLEALQGQRITAELEGMRLGNAFFDPYVAILNEAQFELVRSDDAALLGQDPVCSIIAPADGRYFVQVRDSAFEGSDRCKYRLHVGRFPRPGAVIPAGGRPGETLQVNWLGDTGGAFAGQVTLPSMQHLPKLEWQNAPLLAQTDLGWSPSPVRVRVSDLDNVLEVEPNNDVAGATPLTVAAAANGVIEPASCFTSSRMQPRRVTSTALNCRQKKTSRWTSAFSRVKCCGHHWTASCEFATPLARIWLAMMIPAVLTVTCGLRLLPMATTSSRFRIISVAVALILPTVWK